MSNFFLRLYCWFEKHRMVLWGLLVISMAALGFGISRLDFVEDIGSFFPNSGDNRRINDAYQHIGSDNRMILSIQQKNQGDSVKDIDKELLASVADSLGNRLRQLDKDSLMKDLLYEVSEEQMLTVSRFVLQNMPYFLQEEDYARMDTMLSYDQISAQLAFDRDEILFAPVGFIQDIVLADPLFFAGHTLKQLENFKLNDQFQESDGHIFNQDGTEAVVVVISRFPVSETKNNVRLIAQIDQAIQEVEKQFGGKVEISSFGASLISQTNSQQIKKDSFLAVALSLLLIVALLIYYYRNFKSILLIVCTITFGGLLAMGAIVLFKNPISIIAVGVASIIVGIAINYPIHLLSHFKRTDDKQQIIKDIVNPLLIGNITTVGAFLSLLFISSDAMRDLGLFSALLLVGTILFVLIFLPHLLGKRPARWETATLSFRRVAEFHPEEHPWLMLAVVVLTVVFFVFSFKTSFETNMHEINYMTDAQRAQFEKMIAQADTTEQTIYCIAEGRTLDEALMSFEKTQPVIRQLAEDTTAVRRVSGVSVFLPSQQMQRQKITRWNEFWKDRKAQFLSDFKKAALNNGYTEAAFEDFYRVINQTFTVQTPDYFAPITRQLASSYIVQADDKAMVYTVMTVDKRLREKVEKPLNAIDKHVFAFTDASVITRMVNALSGDFDYVLYICGLIVFAFLIFSFGRLEIALSAFIPLTVAWIWILGIMGMCDLKFNIVNIILATFIFGQGDDYAIFVTEGLIYEHRTGKKMLSQFKNSIILSSSIMFIGIGMLIFAKHPAMRSLAEVAMIGMVSVVMMAYIFPPLLFKWMTTAKGKRRPIPVTLKDIGKTVFSFTVFFLASLCLSLWALFCMIFFPRNQKMKAHFHRQISGLFRFFAKAMPQVTCHVHHESQYDFSKPAVIVANHQSHLDLLYTLMLSPKIVVQTNKWVWNCPFYRRIIRYADCLPVDNGLEVNLPRMRELVAQGYSILIFPEGTRSADGTIGRFHQGAFALAHELKLPVVPLLLHGIGDVFPKNEFMLHKGRVDVTILPPVTLDEQNLEKEMGMLAFTRSFRNDFLHAYEKACQKIETPRYFKELVRSNYLYKGTEVARDCRRQFRHFAQMESMIDHLPDTGTLLIRHAGQGEFALLTALVKKNLQITAVEENADQREVAAYCVSVPANLHYVATAEGNFDVELDMNNFLKEKKDLS